LLADGNQMPMLGLGGWQVPDGPECVNAVRRTLDLGYPSRPTSRESVGTAQEDCRFSVVGVRVIEMLFTEALG